MSALPQEVVIELARNHAAIGRTVQQLAHHLTEFDQHIDGPHARRIKDAAFQIEQRLLAIMELVKAALEGSTHG